MQQRPCPSPPRTARRRPGRARSKSHPATDRNETVLSPPIHAPSLGASNPDVLPPHRISHPKISRLSTPLDSRGPNLTPHVHTNHHNSLLPSDARTRHYPSLPTRVKRSLSPYAQFASHAIAACLKPRCLRQIRGLDRTTAMLKARPSLGRLPWLLLAITNFAHADSPTAPIHDTAPGTPATDRHPSSAPPS